MIPLGKQMILGYKDFRIRPTVHPKIEKNMNVTCYTHNTTEKTTPRLDNNI